MDVLRAQMGFFDMPVSRQGARTAPLDILQTYFGPEVRQ